MSAEYKTSKRIATSDLFDGRLERYGIREAVHEDWGDEYLRCLTDGHNIIGVLLNDEYVWQFTRNSLAGGYGILSVIAEVFNVEIFSEDDPQYWGFETHEEFHQWMKMSGEKLK